MLFSKRFCSPQLAYYIFKGGFGFSFSLMTTIFSLYHIQTVQLNPLQLVAVGAVLEGTCFLLEIPTGVVADVYSRKLSLVVGLVVIGIGLAVEGLFPSFAAILLAQMIWGAGATFLSGADVAWLSDEMGAERANKVLVRGVGVYQMASIAGILLSVVLATINLQVPMVASGVCFSTLGLILVQVMPERAFKGAKSVDLGVAAQYLKQVKKGIHHLRTHRIMLPFLGIVWLGGLYNEGIDRLWVLRLTQDIGLASLPLDEIYWFAIIQIVLLLCNFVAMQILERRIDSMGHKALYFLMGFNNVVLFGALVGFALVSNFYAALLAYWFLMIARGTNEPISTIIMNDTIKDDEIRATVLSMKGLMDQIGQVLGGLFVGFLALRLSVSHGLLVSSSVILVIIGLLGYLWVKEPASKVS